MSEFKLVTCDRCNERFLHEDVGVIRKLFVKPMWFSLKYRWYYRGVHHESHQVCAKDLCPSCTNSFTNWFSSMRESKEVV